MACTDANEREMCKILNDFAVESDLATQPGDVKKNYRKYILKNHPDKIGKKAADELPLPIGEIVERFNNCTEKALSKGREVCAFDTHKPKMKSPSEEEPPNKKSADCIRSVVNWPKPKPYQKFDTRRFNLEKMKNDIPLYSPKLQKLLDNIVEHPLYILF